MTSVGALWAPRSVRRYMPAAAGVAAAASVCLVALRDPNEEGNYPSCPFRAATGLDCPGCGALRAVHALANGDPARAAGHNLLLLLALPVALLHYVAWARPGWAVGSPLVAATRRALSVPAAAWAIVLSVLAFAILRNLPWAPFSALGS